MAYPVSRPAVVESNASRIRAYVLGAEPLGGRFSPVSERSVSDRRSQTLTRAAHFGTPLRQDQKSVLAGFRNLFQEKQATPQVGGVVRPRRLPTGGTQT